MGWAAGSAASSAASNLHLRGGRQSEQGTGDCFILGGGMDKRVGTVRKTVCTAPDEFDKGRADDRR